MNDNLVKKWILKFSDGTYSHVAYYVDHESHQYYYKCSSVKNIMPYKTFEDAAATSYIAEKYGEERKKVRDTAA